MESVQQLRQRAADSSRAAHHMLAEKGAQQWSFADQLAFDALLDEVDRVNTQIDAQSLGAYHSRTVRAQEHSALDLFVRKGMARMSTEELKFVRNTMSTTTPSEGGFSVGPWTAQSVVNALKGYGFVRQFSGQITTKTGGTGAFPTSDGTTEIGEQLAENQAASNLDPSFGTATMPVYRFSSKVFTVPYELVQDSAVDIVAFVMQRARDRIGRIQNQRWTTGTGTSQPTGLVTAASVGKTGTTGQTLTIIYDDLADMIESVDEAQLGMPDSQDGVASTLAGWTFSQTMRKVIRKVKDSSGRPVWMPSYDDGVTRPQRAQLLDYPVFINNDMPAPAANAKSLAFGNLRSYVIRDVLDVKLFRFDDSAFATKGQVGFLAFARAGGNLTDTGAIKLYQHSAT